MECPLTDSVEIVNVACAVTPEPLRVPVPSVAAPSMKVTVPLGVLLAGGCPMTVAVKTTDWPKTEGLTELFTLAVELAFTA